MASSAYSVLPFPTKGVSEYVHLPNPSNARAPLTYSSPQFLPGQWLDVYIPFLPKPGGFTITSTPSQAAPSQSLSLSTSSSDYGHDSPFLELAIQCSPSNAPAAWLWQTPMSLILHKTLHVRVGGSFVWPSTPSVDLSALRKVVFIAGGVGVNPLVSMLCSLAESETRPAFEVHFLYSMRDPGSPRETREMLFLDRIESVFADERLSGGLKLFLTGGGGGGGGGAGDGIVAASGRVDMPYRRRRITVDDVAAVIGQDKDAATVYVCGVPAMTDEFVDKLTSPDGLGMDKQRVQFEKWW